MQDTQKWSMVHLGQANQVYSEAGRIAGAVVTWTGGTVHMHTPRSRPSRLHMTTTMSCATPAEADILDCHVPSGFLSCVPPASVSWRTPASLAHKGCKRIIQHVPVGFKSITTHITLSDLYLRTRIRTDLAWCISSSSPPVRLGVPCPFSSGFSNAFSNTNKRMFSRRQ